MLGRWCRNFLQMLLLSHPPTHLIPLCFNSLLFAVVSAEGVKSLRELSPLPGEDTRLAEFPGKPVGYEGAGNWKPAHRQAHCRAHEQDEPEAFHRREITGNYHLKGFTVSSLFRHN